jgi:hypothetical protein
MQQLAKEFEDSRKFASHIAQSIADMKALCESEIKVDTNSQQL